MNIVMTDMIDNCINKVDAAFAANGCDKHEHRYAETYGLAMAIKIPESIFEIGVFEGASLRSWKALFPRADVTGIDINPNRTVVVPADVKIITGDATRYLPKEKYDWIIDDGSHKNTDTMRAFDNLFWQHLNPGGFYFIEDLHTDYDYIWNDVTAQRVMIYLKELTDAYLMQDGEYEKYNPDHPPRFKRIISGKSIVAIQKNY